MAEETPRALLASFYPDDPILPISGGWGFDKETACVIEANDPAALPGGNFDPWLVIFDFVRKRTYTELIIYRDEGDAFSGIAWSLTERQTIQENGRVYEWMNYEVTAFHDRDWDSLKAEWEGEHGYGTAEFDIKAHQRRRDECQIAIYRAFWFDVTQCYSFRLYGMEIPWVLGVFGRGSLTDYEIAKSGLGYSIAYRGLQHPEIKATVYFYTMGYDEIPDDLEDEILVDEFKSGLDDIFESARRNYETQAELIDSGIFSSADGVPFYLGAECKIESEKEQIKTYLFLKSYKDKFVKIRISTPLRSETRDQSFEFATILNEYLLSN